MSPMPDTRDWMAEDLEAAADTANAQAPAVNWEQLGVIEREARELAEKGGLNAELLGALLERARPAVPSSRDDILSDLRRDLTALI